MSDMVHPEALLYFDRKPWAWRDPSHGEHYRTCDWCGSINPEDLAQELPHWTAEWADRKYGWPHKFYVNIPNREPDRLVVVGSASGGTPLRMRELDPGWVRWEDLTPEQMEVAKRDGYDKREVNPVGLLFGTRNYHHAKFYSIHLSDPAVHPKVKETIERRSGIKFTFDNGQVTWGGVSDGNGGSQG